jgi:membrane-bound lytic murein transglycosylase B
MLSNGSGCESLTILDGQMLKKILVLLIVASPLAAGSAQADAKFEAFIQGIWPRAKAAGIPRELFDAAFSGVTEPDPAVLKLASTQPEFTSTTSAYLSKAVTAIRIDSGQQLKASDAALLSAIEKKYGVDRHILLGIWGMESNFGKDKGSMGVMRSLATLSYAGRKKKYANEQIIAALKILKKGMRSPRDFTGSWAAAMGHTQFIPTSYLSYAVDWTGDGQKDIWGSKEDALASTANYLAKSGWKSDRPWGWEVKLPGNFNKALIGRTKWRPIAEWMKLGITPANGGSFNAPQADAFVMIPQGIEGPAFLVTKNFQAIMAYNFSHSYAIAVGHLGDRIRGAGPFVGSWPDVTYDLSFAQRVELQRRLSGLGFETGGNDGRFGARTYEAIIAYQKSVGLPLDGKPSAKLLERLKGAG